MATIVKAIAPDKIELNLNSRIKLPRDRYALRIKDEEFKVSANGNPMIVLTYEFIAPDFVLGPNGEKVNIAGVELRPMYLTLASKEDKEKSDNLFKRYSDLRALLGVPVPDEGVDIDNPPKVFKGLTVQAICDSKEYAQRKDPTPEQRAKKEPGDKILDEDDKEIKGFNHEVIEVIGLSKSAGRADKPF